MATEAATRDLRVRTNIAALRKDALDEGQQLAVNKLEQTMLRGAFGGSRADGRSVMEQVLQPRPWIDGLDELAANLGVEKVVGMHEGILLMGKTGQYSFVELLTAHVKLMQQTLDRDRSRGFDDPVR